jgi:type II secretory pathway component PulF
MSDSFLQLFQSDPVQAIWALALSVFFYCLFGLVPFFAAVYGIYFLVTLPMRRNERARFFLDLLELGLKEGHSPEAAIMRASSSRDRAPGARFHLLAAYLERGLSLSQALDEVPRLLPPRVNAMLKAGDRIGNLPGVLPACRQTLQDGISHVRGAHNYLIILAFIITPFSVALPLMLRVKILPSFKQVFTGMMEDSSQQLPRLTQFVFANGDLFFFLQLALLAVVWTLMIIYIGGPRLQQWFRGWIPRTVFLWPWTRRRMQRDFSAMLAVLLDAHVPEPEAVRLAGECTASDYMIQRASKIQSLLAGGATLPAAISSIGHTGELSWRLSNALRRGGNFLGALAGWHDALEAKAFQQEQAAAQLTTTVLVLLNGLAVGLIVIGMFSAITNLLNRAVLW